MKIGIKTLVLMILVCLSAHCLAKESEWVKKLDKDGIIVYTSKVEGSELDAFRATVEVESSLSAIVALLRDYDHYPKWMYRTSSAKLLKKEGNQSFVYTVSEAPWPVKSRDNINSTRFVQNPDNKEILISIKAVPDFLPEKKEYIRIPEAVGYWKMTPTGRNKVSITYQMKTDSGGNLPAWLANMAVTQAPYQILSSLRDEIKKPKYRSAKIEGLVE